MNILCIGHRKQQGKDTAAKNLQTQLLMQYPGLRVKIASFAEPIYKICNVLDPNFKTKMYYDLNPSEKSEPLPSGITPREMLISVGQGLKSVLWDDLWVRLVMNTPDCDFLIIADLRFKDEATYFKNKAKFMRITRSEVPGDVADDDLNGFEWDTTIYNTGTIREMSNKVIEYVKSAYHF